MKISKTSKRKPGDRKCNFSTDLICDIIKDIVEYRQLGYTQKEIDYCIKKDYHINNPVNMRKYANFLERMGMVNVVIDKESTLDKIARARQHQLVQQKITTKQRKILNDTANIDAFRELILNAIKEYPYTKYSKANKVSKNTLKTSNKGIVIISDEHFKGDCDVEHLNALYDNIEIDIELSDYKEVELWYLGDGIDGLIHTGSLASNDGSIQPAIQYCNILIERVNRIPQIKGVKFVSMSNHTQTRALGTSRNELAREDLGLMIAEMLKFGLRKDIDLVADEIIRFKENGFNVALLHGHQPYAKTKAKMLEYWNSKYDLVPDLTIMGHYHTFKQNEYGDNKWLVVAPTAKNFNGDYENSQGFISTNQYLLLEFIDGAPQFTVRRIR